MSQSATEATPAAQLGGIGNLAARARGPAASSRPSQLPPKLVIGAPDDEFEREADLVAERVMRVPERAPPPYGDGSAALQPASVPRVQMKSSRHGPVAEDEAPPIVHDVLRAPGRPLDTSTRAFFEPRFGRDLGGVRVHTDAKASLSAATVGAQAYTVGTSVVFGAGNYRPNTAAGRTLIAHELAHVVQQGGAPQARPDQGAAARSTAPSTQVGRIGNAPQLTISRVSRLMLQRLRICELPSMHVANQDASDFGHFAEAKIQAHYCLQQGCTPGVGEYFDHATSSSKEFVTFLASKNPLHDYMLTLPYPQRPDILAHRPERKDFYEIKPDSESGRADGRDKIRNLQSYFLVHNLPYLTGFVYDPNVEESLWKFSYLGNDYEFFLSFRRILPGLVVYKVCVEFTSPAYEWIIKLLLIALIAFLLRGAIKTLPGESDFAPVPGYAAAGNQKGRQGTDARDPAASQDA